MKSKFCEVENAWYWVWSVRGVMQAKKFACERYESAGKMHCAHTTLGLLVMGSYGWQHTPRQ